MKFKEKYFVILTKAQSTRVFNSLVSERERPLSRLRSRELKVIRRERDLISSPEMFFYHDR